MRHFPDYDINKTDIGVMIREQLGEDTLTRIGAKDMNINPLQRNALKLLNLKGGISFNVKENPDSIKAIGVYQRTRGKNLLNIRFFGKDGILKSYDKIQPSELPELIFQTIKS